MTAKTAVHSSWLDVIEDRTVTHRIGHSRGSLKPACMHAAWYLGRQMCARIPDACDELTKKLEGSPDISRTDLSTHVDARLLCELRQTAAVGRCGSEVH